MHVETDTEEIQVSPNDDCFAIRQAARYVTQLYDRHLGQVGLKTTQFSIMCRLRRRKWMTMKELADSMVQAARDHWFAAQEEFEQRFGPQRAASLREELFDMTKR